MEGIVVGMVVGIEGIGGRLSCGSDGMVLGSGGIVLVRDGRLG